MPYRENKLSFAEVFTIQAKTSYGNTTSMKIYRSVKAAQKAADKANTKEDDKTFVWKVLPLNVSYQEEVVAENNKIVDRAKETLPVVLKHLEDDSVEIETFDMGITDEINILRWQPYPGKQQCVKGDRSIIVTLNMKYRIDV